VPHPLSGRPLLRLFPCSASDRNTELFPGFSMRIGNCWRSPAIPPPPRRPFSHVYGQSLIDAILPRERRDTPPHHALARSYFYFFRGRRCGWWAFVLRLVMLRSFSNTDTFYTFSLGHYSFTPFPSRKNKLTTLCMSTFPCPNLM